VPLPTPTCSCSPYYDLDGGTANSPSFLNDTNALFFVLQTNDAWPLSLPVYDPKWGCACESAEDRPVWLAALDLCFWFDTLNATQRDVLFTSGQLQESYNRTCSASAPGEQVNEYYHHVRLCATPAFVRYNYYLSKEYCIPEAANNFTLYPRLARDGAMMCGTDIGPVGPTQSNEDADCPCNTFFDYDALANSSSTALDTVNTFYAAISQPNSSWPVRRPATRDGECGCDDPDFRPVWLAPIDMCDYYARQPPEVQALLLPPGDPAAQAVFERACLGLSREEQNRDFMHVKFCADRAFITDIFYEHDYCQRPDESGQLIPLTAPDGLLFCQGIIPAPAPPPLIPPPYLPLERSALPLVDTGSDNLRLPLILGICISTCLCCCCLVLAAARRRQGSVFSVAYSPDGSRVATVGSDSALRVWDASSDLSSPSIQQATAHRGDIFSVVFLPDGTRIATGGSDGALRVWDASDLSSPPLEKPNAHSSAIYSVAYSPDGSRIATVGDDGALRVWDASDLASPLVVGVDAHTSAIYSVSFSVDGCRLATVGDDRALRVWDAASDLSSPLMERATTSGIYSVAYSPDGSRLATVGGDGALRVWDAASDLSSPVLERTDAHSGVLRAVAYSPNGDHVATGGGDRALRVWPTPPLLEQPPPAVTTISSAVAAGTAVSRRGLLERKPRLCIDAATPAGTQHLQSAIVQAVSAVPIAPEAATVQAQGRPDILIVRALSSPSDAAEACAICLDPLVATATGNLACYTLSCGHRFHARCMITQARSSTSSNACPLCRAIDGAAGSPSTSAGLPSTSTEGEGSEKV